MKTKNTTKKEQTSQEISEQDLNTINSFISNKENQQKAEEIARQIKRNFKNWFTVKDFIKHFNMSLNDIEVQLRSLIMFKVCVIRKNKVNGLSEFKIVLTKESLLKVLQDQLREVDIERALLIKEIEGLK